jgi:protein-S-isoprenylcysteine O-methyltransferase Ste14
MRAPLFWALVASLTLSNALLILSIVRPDLRFWPPPDPPSRRHRYARVNAVLGPLTVVGFFALGVLDWNEGPLLERPWVRALGAPLFGFGGAFALWGYFGLGVQPSQGHHEGLVASGAFRYSRNPQYVGTILCLLGYALISNSTFALLVWLFWSAWFLMAPFAEEPWLRAHLGAPYDAYVARVPRFLGRRSAD